MDKALNSVDAEITPVDAYFLGRAVAANILAAYKPYTRNAELTQYVNRICQTLAINSSQPTAYNGYHVIILDSAEFNAFASPGGHIFITKGLAAAAASEDMLAAVIAHELAHIMLKHSIDIINEVRFTDDMMAVADRAASIAAKNSTSAAQLLYFRESVAKSIDTLMKNGYAQSQEFNADMEAVVLLAYAGYDPSALVDMLRVLQRVQSSQKGGWYTTHPSPRERIANLETLRFRATDTRKYRAPRFKSMRF
jgi:predicted Zn-dependent protease